MDKPHCAEAAPAFVQLEPGTYKWCACGLSKNQPFCDNSHPETPFHPLEFTVSTSKRLGLCQCKQTGKPPYCDGTHSTIED